MNDSPESSRVGSDRGRPRPGGRAAGQGARTSPRFAMRILLNSFSRAAVLMLLHCPSVTPMLSSCAADTRRTAAAPEELADAAVTEAAAAAGDAAAATLCAI